MALASLRWVDESLLAETGLLDRWLWGVLEPVGVLEPIGVLAPGVPDPVDDREPTDVLELVDDFDPGFDLAEPATFGVAKRPGLRDLDPVGVTAPVGVLRPVGVLLPLAIVERGVVVVGVLLPEWGVASVVWPLPRRGVDVRDPSES